MKFLGILALLIFVQIISADKELNGTHELEAQVGESREGRTIITKLGCPSTSTTGTMGISDFLSSISTIISNFFNPDLSSLSNLKQNITIPNIDINSIVNQDPSTLTNIKMSIPLLFFISVIVGIIAAVITLIIPAYIQPDNVIDNVMDTMYGFMQQAMADVPNAQYGSPAQYTSQDNYYSPSTDYSQYQNPSSSYNSPSSTYTDPSNAYDHRRYSPQSSFNIPQTYPSVSTNYLRTEKS